MRKAPIKLGSNVALNIDACTQVLGKITIFWSRWYLRRKVSTANAYREKPNPYKMSFDNMIIVIDNPECTAILVRNQSVDTKIALTVINITYRFILTYGIWYTYIDYIVFLRFWVQRRTYCTGFNTIRVFYYFFFFLYQYTESRQLLK